MKKCPYCGTNYSWFDRFKINFDNDIYVACNKCGRELVDRTKFVYHMLLIGLIFGVLLWVDLPLESVALEYLFEFCFLIIYYILFIPFEKKKDSWNE